MEAYRTQNQDFQNLYFETTQQNLYDLREESEEDGSEVAGMVSSTSSKITSKFGFKDDVTSEVSNIINVVTNTSSAPKFSVNVKSSIYSGDLVILDFSWYEPFKDLGDNVICIFVYINFVWHIFLKLPDIINGVGASEYTNFDNMIGDIQAYKNTGFGRSKHI